MSRLFFFLKVDIWTKREKRREGTTKKGEKCEQLVDIFFVQGGQFRGIRVHLCADLRSTSSCHPEPDLGVP